MSTLTAPATAVRHRRSSTPAKVGDVLAVLQGVGCIALGIAQFSTDWGIIVSGVMIVAGVAALALAVPIWRGVRWAGGVVGGLLLLQSLGGIPAFVFDPGLVWRIVAASGMALAVLTLVLLLAPGRKAIGR